MASIGILGNGVSGMATAIAIAQTHTFDVQLYEFAEDTNPPPLQVDETHHLTPNASRVFKAIGCTVPESAITPEQLQVRSARNGFAMSQQPMGLLTTARWHAPYLLLAESALRAELASRARALPIEHHQVDDAGWTKLYEANVGAWILAENIGAEDLAIGAVAPPQKAPTVAAAGPIAAKTASLSANQLSEEFAKLNNRLIMAHWLAPNQCIQHSPRPDGGMDLLWLWNSAATGAERAVPSHSTPELQQLLANSKFATHHWDQVTETAGSFDPSKPLAVSGFACANPLPLLNQRTALAFEDAWVLSRMFEQHEDDLALAVAEYEGYRTRRRQRVQEQISKLALRYLAQDTATRWQRNLSLVLGSRFLPELALSRLDWLYGYDCIRGFH